MKATHTTVFLKEAVEALRVRKGGLYIDATYGQGGHSHEIVRQGGTVLALDADKSQLQGADSAITLVEGNFADIKEIAQNHDFTEVDGVLFDFGLSMKQLSESGKGFSYDRPDDALDMRLSGKGKTVSEFLFDTDTQTLEHALMKYSEDINSPKIAHEIVRVRSRNNIATVGDLIKIINAVVKGDHEMRKKTYARIFQALRIIINDELSSIQNGLLGALEITSKGGRIVIITFHSLEDRVVKSFARSYSQRLSEEIIRVQKSRNLHRFERSATLRVFTVR